MLGCSPDILVDILFSLITCLQERILFSVIGHNDFDESPDLVLTEDFGGVNAGMGD
jgi:mannan polymerase II complex MNN10 subunit